MKKKILIFLILFPLLFMTIYCDYKIVNIKVDGEETSFFDEKQNIYFTPIIYKDRALLPLRFALNLMGVDDGNIKWDGKNKKITVFSNSGKKIELKLNSNEVYVDDELIVIDTEAILYKDRTFVPIRILSEIIGVDVDWESKTKTVLLNPSKYLLKDGKENCGHFILDRKYGFEIIDVYENVFSYQTYKNNENEIIYIEKVENKSLDNILKEHHVSIEDFTMIKDNSNRIYKYDDNKKHGLGVVVLGDMTFTINTENTPESVLIDITKSLEE